MPKKRADGRYENKVKISRAGEPRKYAAVYGKTLRQAREKMEVYTHLGWQDIDAEQINNIFRAC